MWYRANIQVPPDADRAVFGNARHSARSFRKHLAALDTKYQFGLDNSLFGYDSDGKPVNGFNPFTIAVTRGSVYLAAVGAEACGYLRGAAGSIHSALIRESGRLMLMTEQSGEHELTVTSYPQRHFIKSLSLGKSRKGSFWMTAADHVRDGSAWVKEADRALPKAISRGLLRQADYLIAQDDDVFGEGEGGGAWLSRSAGSGMHLGERYVKFREKLDVQVQSVERHIYCTDTRHTTIVLLGVQLTMKARLSGIWNTGRSRNEGRGLIVPSTRAWTDSEAKAAQPQTEAVPA